MATALHPTAVTSTSSIASQSFGLAPTTQPLRSPWHSPVPYLFGGLAAMLGLIAFALLILACSYWRLSSDDDENQENDLEKGEGVSKIKGPPVYEEKIVVIMAGDDKPTFLANPVQIFLNSTPNYSNQQVIVDPISKIGAQNESTNTSSVFDEKPKEDENVQQHQS